MPMLEEIAKKLHDHNFLVTEIKTGLLSIKKVSNTQPVVIPICLIESKKNRIFVCVIYNFSLTAKVFAAIQESFTLETF